MVGPVLILILAFAMSRVENVKASLLSLLTISQKSLLQALPLSAKRGDMARKSPLNEKPIHHLYSPG